MNINTTNASTPSGFYAADFETFATTLDESEITFTIDMGGVTLHHGTRNNSPVWLMDNPLGRLYGIWVEVDAISPH